MTKSQRNLVLSVATLVACSVFGRVAMLNAAEADAPATGDNPVKAQLEHAVDSIIAAAKTSVAAAKTDQNARSDSPHRATGRFQHRGPIGQVNGGVTRRLAAFSH
jgi:hypothetical protein